MEHVFGGKRKTGKIESSRLQISTGRKITRLFELVPVYRGAAQEPFSFAGPQLLV